MFSGVINFGLGHAKSDQPWKALYYFCGSVTIAWSFVVYFFLPNSPLDPGRFFNAREREVLVRRFEENPYGRDRQPFKMDQVKEAALDIKTYIYFLMASAIYVCPFMNVSSARLMIRSVMDRSRLSELELSMALGTVLSTVSLS
jgi:hypothetical protein